MVFDKKFIVIGAVAVVVAAGALWFFVGRNTSDMNGSGIPGPAPVSSTPQTLTREPAPVNVVVPGENSTSTPVNVAVPDIVSRGSPNDASSYRGFAIRAEHNQFIPDTVIVKVGDTIDITMTAVDKNYDFTQPDFGFHTDIAQGATQKIQFNASDTGKFIFYCKSCGGPSAGPVGYIVIAK